MYVKRSNGHYSLFGRVIGLTVLLFFCFGGVVWAFGSLAPFRIAYLESDNELHLLLRPSDEAGNDLNWEKDLHKLSWLLSSLLSNQNFPEKQLLKQSQGCKQNDFSCISLRSPPAIFCY